jgi:hypothetical protein
MELGAGIRSAGDTEDVPITLPPTAAEIVFEYYADELRAGLREFGEFAEVGREFTVDDLLRVQSELERVQTATEVLLRSRPDHEWEDDTGGAS